MDMTEDNNNRSRRPLWFVMLVLLSVLPMMVWMYAFEKMNGTVEGTVKFLLNGFPVYVLAMLGLAYYVYPERPEVSRVLMVVTWLSYAGLGAMAYLA